MKISNILIWACLSMWASSSLAKGHNLNNLAYDILEAREKVCTTYKWQVLNILSSFWINNNNIFTLINWVCWHSKTKKGNRNK